MIEIDIPSIDPIQHEPKVFVGLTARQIIFVVPGVTLGAALFAMAFKTSTDLAIVALMITVIPAVCFGWARPYNLKFEQYLQLLYFNMFVSNPKRIYKTDSAEEKKFQTLKELEASAKNQKETALKEKKTKKKDNKSNKEEL